MSKPAVQQSAFKQLYTDMLAQGGDFSKVSKDLKKPLKTYVKESYPFFLVTDGFFFVQAHFTKEAVAEFKSKFANVNITDLHDRVIVISNWSLEMRRVNSADLFTSYANLEIRLIVHSFKPNLNEKLNPTRYPINLFRDDEFKTQIQQFRHAAIQASLAKSAKADSLPDIAKVSTASAGKGKVEGGIVKAGSGKGDEFAEFSFKEGNTAVLSLKDIFVQEKGKGASDVPAFPLLPRLRVALKERARLHQNPLERLQRLPERRRVLILKRALIRLSSIPQANQQARRRPHKRLHLLESNQLQRNQLERNRLQPCHPQEARSPPRQLTK
jgi:hypothetical protein